MSKTIATERAVYEALRNVAENADDLLAELVKLEAMVVVAGPEEPPA